MAKILVIEPNLNQAESLCAALEEAKHAVLHSGSGPQAVSLAKLQVPDIAIVAFHGRVSLGLSVCRQLRAEPECRSAFILAIVDGRSEEDQLLAYAEGVEDCVTRPVSNKVLLARIRAMLRRRQIQDTAASGGVIVDSARHLVFVDGRRVDLTLYQFRLLQTLIRRPGRVFSRSELLSALGAENQPEEQRVVDVCILRLRKRLDGCADMIETVRGVGYRFRENPRPEEEHAVRWPRHGDDPPDSRTCRLRSVAS